MTRNRLNDVTLRPAAPSDIPAITRIYADAVMHGTASFELEAPDEAEMMRRYEALVGNGYPYLVATLSGAIAGYAYGGPYRARPAYKWTIENSIYVAPEFHRRGIGLRLLKELIAESERRGFRQMIAVIGDSAQTASIARACGGGLRAGRRVPRDRLQARQMARHTADADRARQRRYGAAVNAVSETRCARETKRHYPATTRSERSSALSTRSSSWPRRRMWPVAEITL